MSTDAETLPARMNSHRITIARLRFWIVSLGALLVVVIAAFLTYAHYKTRRAIRDIPERLGGQIERSSNGFTYSQSLRGHPAFTIHASNATQYKGGSRAVLHDVAITLYGPEGNRHDQITGSEFDYDQKAGIVKAQGEVLIDLQGAPSPNSSPSSTPANTVHVKTSGLSFDQKTGTASTTQFVEFSLPKGSGSSTGASYDSKKGLLVLDSAVEIRASASGDPVLVKAAHAEFLRDTNQAFLLNPICDFRDDHASAQQAIVYFRKDGTADRVNAKGSLHVRTDAGDDLTGQTAVITLDDKGEPLRMDAGGGLLFVSSDPNQRMTGNAVEATLQFENGTLKHAQARNTVTFTARQSIPGDAAGLMNRELRASQVDVNFAAGLNRQATAQEVLATGGSTVVMHTIRSNTPSQNTTIRGDTLLASLAGGNQITGLHGSGHTSITQITQDGAQNTSTGDELQADFNPPPGGTKSAHDAKDLTPLETSQIRSAVQQGHVTLTRIPAKTASGEQPQPLKGEAHRAEYDGASQIVHLLGSPRLSDGIMELTSAAIDYFRDSGNASAEGNVSASYLQDKQAPHGSGATVLGGQGVTHVVSERAALNRAQGQALFSGHAKLWQGGNSVSAPVIQLTRNPQTLTAEAEKSVPVSTVITSAADNNNRTQVYRVRSQKLFYSDSERRAVFTGSVSAEDQDGTVESSKTEIFLSKAQPQTAHASGSTGPSQIDKVIATGHVTLEQPGRRATGEELVYTSEDGKFVLTGTPRTPPRLTDQSHGTVTGVALIFNNRDDSVSVSGGKSSAVTDTRAPK